MFMSLAGLCLATFPTQWHVSSSVFYIWGAEAPRVQGCTFHLPASSLKPTPAEDWLHLPVFPVLPIENCKSPLQSHC